MAANFYLDFVTNHFKMFIKGNILRYAKISFKWKRTRGAGLLSIFLFSLTLIAPGFGFHYCTSQSL